MKEAEEHERRGDENNLHPFPMSHIIELCWAFLCIWKTYKNHYQGVAFWNSGPGFCLDCSIIFCYIICYMFSVIMKAKVTCITHVVVNYYFFHQVDILRPYFPWESQLGKERGYERIHWESIGKDFSIFLVGNKRGKF